jgi:hypothetical protein
MGCGRELNCPLRDQAPAPAPKKGWKAMLRRLVTWEDTVTPEPTANFQRARLPQVRWGVCMCVCMSG